MVSGKIGTTQPIGGTLDDPPKPTPPAGYKLNVNAPAGYKLNTPAGDPDDPDIGDSNGPSLAGGTGDNERADNGTLIPKHIPAFIQNGVNPVLGQQIDDTRNAEAHPDEAAFVTTDGSDPLLAINETHPEQIDQGKLTHEMDHVFQATRSTDIPRSYADTYGAGHDNYKTGGVYGLNLARNSGKHASDLNMEQQAELVREYKMAHDKYLDKARAGTATKKDLKDFSDMHAAYHPFIKEMAAVPNQDQGETQHLAPGLLDMLTGSNMPTINTRPEAPGLPRADTPGLGVMEADPLMGGRSVSIPTGALTKISDKPKPKPKQKDKD